MAERFQLENGLTVVFEEQHAARVAAFQVWVKAGSADERVDQAGLAHLHEHMLFKGTARRGVGEIAREIESHGGNINAWTSFDQTVYHTVIASQYARMGLDVLADAVRSSAFDAGELAREIEVVCEEIKRAHDMPGRRASYDLFKTAFQVHPYGRPVIGWEETVRSFTREKVQEFYLAHYTPRNMVVTAVGDFREAELRNWVEEMFSGDWGRPYAGRRQRTEEPRWLERRALVRQDDVKEAYVNLAFLIPPVRHQDIPALDLLGAIAGDGESSRLSIALERRERLVNDVSASTYTPHDQGLFLASFTAPREKVERALETLARELWRLKRTRVPEEEVALVRAKLEADAIYRRETVQGLSRALGAFETEGGIEEEARYYAELSKVTPERLLEVAERYLDFDRMGLTALLPPETALTEHSAFEIIDRAGTLPHTGHEQRVHHVPVAKVQLTPRAALAASSTKTLVTRLSSGAQLIVRPETAAPLFAMRAAYLGGVRFENEADNGLTTLLARTWTRGTQSRDAERISREVDAMAGGLGGQGGRNSVNLRSEFLSRHFDRAFDLFAEVLETPAFAPEEVEREKALLEQDLITRDDKPASLVFELFHRTLFRRHPYRFSTLGEQASLQRLDAEALRRFHQEHLDPSQLTLAVVGDVDPEVVLRRAEAAFGRSRGQAQPPPQVPAEDFSGLPRTATVALERNQTHLVLGFPGLTVEDPDRFALDVLSSVLSGQGGRLFLELRDKRSMAYSVRSYAVGGIDPGYFAVYMGTSPEKVDAALAGIREELEKIRDRPISADELSRTQQMLAGAHEIGLQRNGARAAMLALDHCYGLGMENFADYAARVQAVTTEDVARVARRLLDFDRSALAIVGPSTLAG